MYTFYCKSDEMHTDFICILNYTILALHVSGAICTLHHVCINTPHKGDSIFTYYYYYYYYY
jgi:hypothetical protein